MFHKRLVGAAVATAALALPTAAAAADRDHDRMRDSWEKRYGLSTKTNDARLDRDRDRLRNIDEYRSGTNPSRRDSDGDGRRDDREGAGTIKSFDAATGVLVIDVFASTTDLTGKVDATTKIECEDEDRDDDGSGRNSGPGGGHNRSDEGYDERNCTTAELTAGRTVKEAELHTGDDGPHDVFDEVELR